MRWLWAFLLLPSLAWGQHVTGPLQTQNNLGEIAANGTQATARTNLGIGSTPGPYLPLAGGTVTGPATFNLGTIVLSSRYDATAFGNCTWAPGNDVAPCINLAIAASTANPGLVIVPSGTFNIGSTITNGTSGVKLQGGGSGINIDNTVGDVAITHLIWTGATGGTMLDVEPSGSTSLYNVDVTGLVLDCANLANICAKFEQVSFSKLDVLGVNARVHDILMTTETAGFDSPGNQNNEIWFQSRSNSTSFSPTGITLDSGVGCATNTSYNRIHLLATAYAKGDGIVFGCTDNNLIDSEDSIQIQAAPNNTGTPIVFANSTYTSPNGYKVNGSAGEGNVILKTASSGVVQGFQTGSTVVAGVHAGTAAVTTIPLVTTSPAVTIGGSPLTFASTTGVLSGMVANCGAWSCGLAPNTQVLNSVGSVTPTTVATVQGAVGTVAIGTTVTFGYGIAIFAVQGTYTMTAVDGTHWSLTAPAGGHSDAGRALIGGAVSFEDMVIPLTGTPVAGDTFVITVPRPVTNIAFHSVDKSNSVQDMAVEAGAGIFTDSTRNPIPHSIGGTGNVTIKPTNGTNNAVSIGGANSNAAGPYAAQTGGAGTAATGFGCGVYAGNNLICGGAYDFAHGENNTTGGEASEVGGNNCNDRNHYAAWCWASGAFAVQGDAQGRTMVLRGTGASTTPIALTADGNAAGNAPNPNCINIPSLTAYLIEINVLAFDHTNASKNEAWARWSGILNRQAAASTTTLTMQSTPTPIVNGTLTGSSISATADTTNGCLTLAFTPPSGNTDTWNAVARVTTVEAQ